MSRGSKLRQALAGLVGAEAVLADVPPHYRHDAAALPIDGRPAEAVVLPDSTGDVAAVVAWCYRHDVPITPRGGGTGLVGGAVATEGGITLGLERLRAIRSFEPAWWRISIEAGLPTAHVQRLARENGLLFPPDPGAGEQSQIGGNVATNAGGPHAFKYGVVGTWVSGLEVVMAPGRVTRFGRGVRKDAAGYDIKSLMVGSEGTLGVITAVELKLLPAPEACLPIVAFYPDLEAGCNAISQVVGSGLQPAALEFLDQGAVDSVAGSFPGDLPGVAGFVLLAEADGTVSEALKLRGDLVEVLSDGAIGVIGEPEPGLWRWRDGISTAVATRRGSKLSEDISVPGERLQEAIEAVQELGRRHSVPGCSWGHAGDGNLHATFMLDGTARELKRAEQAADELFELAHRLGGSVSGEHGIGSSKQKAWAALIAEEDLELQRGLKHLFDPKGLLNPGKVIASARLRGIREPVDL